MRRLVSSLLIVCFCSLSALAQSIPVRYSGENPQIAYHLFSNWADNYMVQAKHGRTIAQSILYSGSAISFAGAALTWYGGDEISNRVNGSPMDPDLKQGLTLGLGIGGGVLLMSGAIIGSVPIKDYRAIYADVFEEKDPEVQEAMAASVLRYQADRGKERRITSFISGLVVPVIALGVTVGVNAAQDRAWNYGLANSMGGSSWGMAGSIVSLFQKTPEERLYERYLSTRDALYDERK